MYGLQVARVQYITVPTDNPNLMHSGNGKGVFPRWHGLQLEHLMNHLQQVSHSNRQTKHQRTPHCTKIPHSTNIKTIIQMLCTMMLQNKQIYYTIFKYTVLQSILTVYLHSPKCSYIQKLTLSVKQWKPVLSNITQVERKIS